MNININKLIIILILLLSLLVVVVMIVFMTGARGNQPKFIYGCVLSVLLALPVTRIRDASTPTP
jgi:hypothetical protein